MFPANSEGWLISVIFPAGAPSVMCEGLTNSPRMRDPLALASSQSLDYPSCCAPGLGGAALPPPPMWRAGVVHSRPVPCAL